MVPKKEKQKPKSWNISWLFDDNDVLIYKEIYQSYPNLCVMAYPNHTIKGKYLKLGIL